jgi:hypothetical protein
MTELGKRGGESIQGCRCHAIRSIKNDNLPGNSEGGSKFQCISDTKEPAYIVLELTRVKPEPNLNLTRT